MGVPSKPKSTPESSISKPIAKKKVSVNVKTTSTFNSKNAPSPFVGVKKSTSPRSSSSPSSSSLQTTQSTASNRSTSNSSVSNNEEKTSTSNVQRGTLKQKRPSLASAPSVKDAISRFQTQDS